MAEFDAEVKNSLASMQAAVVSLEAKVDKADRSLKRMQESARGVGHALHESAGEAERHSAAVEKLERGMEGSRKSARLLGGEAGTLTREFTELATNPWALAAGGAFALVGGAVEMVTDHIKELREQTEELVRVGEAGVAGKAAGIKGAVDATNVQEDRKRAFEKQGGPVPSISLVPEENRADVLAAADQAVAAGMAKSQEEFVTKLLAAKKADLEALAKYDSDQKAVKRAIGSGPNDAYTIVGRALGDKENDPTRAPEPERPPSPFTGKSPAQLAVTGTGSDLSPEEFQDRLRRAEQSETGRLARIAEQRKAAEERAAEADRMRGLRSAAGESGGLTIADLRKTTPALDEALKKSEAREMEARALYNEEGRTGGSFWTDTKRTFGGGGGWPDDNIREEQARQQELIRAARRGIDQPEGEKQRDSIFKQASDAYDRQEELLKQQLAETKRNTDRLGDVLDAVKTQNQARADASAQVNTDARLQSALSQQAADQAAAATSNR